MRRILVVLSLAMTILLLVVACAPGTPAPETAPQQEPAAEEPAAEEPAAEEPAAEEPATEEPAAEEPTEEPAAQVPAGEGCGHDILIGINGDGQSVNPLYGSDSSTVFRTDQISEPLVFLDWETLEPIPWLAESWEISDDGRTYTFTLREGPQWPDGTPLTAQDFEFTLETIISPDYTGPWQGLYADIVGADAKIAGDADEVEGIEVIDDRTFELNLNEPNAAFLVIAARNLKPIPRHLLEGETLTLEHPFMLDPIGVGPYRVAERLPGDHTTLELKDNYWGGVEPVCARTITERIIPDMEALASAIESGSVDQMNPLEPRYILRFNDNPDINVNQVPASIQDGLWFNLENEYLASKEVRQAIAMTVNPQEFADTVLGGVQAPAFSPLAPASWAYDASIQQPEQNLERARELLEEAGYGDGFTVTIRTNAGNTTRERMATYLQAQLAEIGITAEVEFQEWSTFFTRVVDGDYDIVVLSSTAGIPDPDTMYNIFHSEAAGNWSNYSNPEVDSLLEQARASTDQAERVDLYHQVQEILVEELPMTWAYAYLSDTATRSNISNVRPSALGPMWDAKYWRKN
jgi:peptide/nickel transport system substrate-binding protein